MLTVFYSNRLEILIEALIASHHASSQANQAVEETNFSFEKASKRNNFNLNTLSQRKKISQIFAPTHIIVPHMGIASLIELTWARRHYICTHLKFSNIEQWLENTLNQIRKQIDQKAQYKANTIFNNELWSIDQANDSSFQNLSQILHHSKQHFQINSCQSLNFADLTWQLFFIINQLVEKRSAEKISEEPTKNSIEQLAQSHRELLTKLIAQHFDQVNSQSLEKQFEAPWLDNSIEKNHLKRYQIAQRLAHLFIRYQATRDEWLKKWSAGEKPNFISHSHPNYFDNEAWQPHAVWQSKIWQLLKQYWPKLIEQASAADDDDINLYIKKISTANQSYENGINQKISIVAPVCLLPKQLSWIEKLSKIIDIEFYILNPCEQYWSDLITTQKANQLVLQNKWDYQEIGHALLSDWAKPTRIFLSNLNEVTERLMSQPNKKNKVSKNIENSSIIQTSAYIENNQQTLLAVLQNSILTLRPIVFDEIANQLTELGIEFHACHSLTRQLQVLHNRLLTWFDHDSTLKPGDVLVVLPDIAKAQPFIEAEFGKEVLLKTKLSEFISKADIPKKQAKSLLKPNIPYQIAVQNETKNNTIIQLFLSLLTIDKHDISVHQFFDWLNQDVIAAKYNLNVSQLPQILQALVDAGARQVFSTHTVKPNQATNHVSESNSDESNVFNLDEHKSSISTLDISSSRNLNDNANFSVILNKINLKNKTETKNIQDIEDNQQNHFNAKKIFDLPNQNASENIAKNTFLQALDRLLLSLIMPEDIMPLVGETALLPQPLTFSKKELESIYCFYNDLKAFTSLTSHSHSVNNWRLILHNSLNTFFNFNIADKVEKNAFKKLTHAIDGWAKQIQSSLAQPNSNYFPTQKNTSALNNPIENNLSFTSYLHLDCHIVAQALSDYLSDNELDPLPSGSIIFAQIRSLQFMPYRIIAIIDMDEGTWPKTYSKEEWDLTAIFPRLSDPQCREIEKNIFLDLILAARERVFIAYNGKNMTDNQVQQPATQISSLLDYLTDATTASNISEEEWQAARQRFITEHPRYHFSNIKPTQAKEYDLFSSQNKKQFEYSTHINEIHYNANNLRIAKQLAKNNKRINSQKKVNLINSFELNFKNKLLSNTKQWHLCPPKLTSINNTELTQFWVNPSRYFFQRHIGIKLNSSTQTKQDYFGKMLYQNSYEGIIDERYQINKKTKHQMLKRLLSLIMPNNNMSLSTWGKIDNLNDSDAYWQNALYILLANPAMPGNALGKAIAKRELNRFCQFLQQIQLTLLTTVETNQKQLNSYPNFIDGQISALSISSIFSTPPTQSTSTFSLTEWIAQNLLAKPISPIELIQYNHYFSKYCTTATINFRLEIKPDWKQAGLKNFSDNLTLSGRINGINSNGRFVWEYRKANAVILMSTWIDHLILNVLASDSSFSWTIEKSLTENNLANHLNEDHLSFTNFFASNTMNQWLETINKQNNANEFSNELKATFEAEVKTIPQQFTSYWIGDNDSFRFTPVENAKTYLQIFLAAYQAGMQKPYPFFLRTAYAFCREGLLRARQTFYGTSIKEGSKIRGEKENAYFQLAWDESLLIQLFSNYHLLNEAELEKKLSDTEFQEKENNINFEEIINADLSQNSFTYVAKAIFEPMFKHLIMRSEE